MYRLVFMLGGFALMSSALAAQNPPDKPADDRWQLTIDDGSYIWDIRLVRLDGENLVFRQADSLGKVSVQRITEIRRIQKTTVSLAEGAGAGGAMGALTGADDEVYDLIALDFPGRLRAVQQIFLLHPPAQ
jgi:hypothetical protein